MKFLKQTVRFLRRLFILVLFFSIGPVKAGDGIQYLYLDTPTYDYFDYMINASQLKPKFIFRQPYELDRDLVIDSMTTAGKYFKSYWQQYYKNDHASFHLGGSDYMKYDEAIYNRFKVQLGVQYIASHISLVNRITGDQNYKRDPLFAGDLSESEHWVYGRINEAFINVNFGKFDLFYGRIQRNWGLLNDYSLILSSNPYTYDHLLMNYTTDYIKFSLIYAQLEDIDGQNFRYPDSIITDNKKHLVGHRLDIRFSDDFQIGLSEMATYGGPDQEFEPAFMNPMNFYYPTQRNDKKEMNGFWALDLFYRPLNKLTYWMQFLIDDVIINNDPGEDDRGQYPDRMGIIASLRSADPIISGLNLNLTYNRVWNRTYQAKYTWQNYHYRGYGLGYPCASCEEIKIKIGYWNLFPLIIDNNTTYGRYGSVQLTDIYPFEKEDFPVSPVQNNLINELSIKFLYDPSLNFWASVT
jgi:hypothetical protein